MTLDGHFESSGARNVAIGWMAGSLSGDHSRPVTFRTHEEPKGPSSPASSRTK